MDFGRWLHCLRFVVSRPARWTSGGGRGLRWLRKICPAENSRTKRTSLQKPRRTPTDSSSEPHERRWARHDNSKYHFLEWRKERPTQMEVRHHRPSGAHSTGSRCIVDSSPGPDAGNESTPRGSPMGFIGSRWTSSKARPRPVRFGLPPPFLGDDQTTQA